MKNIKELDKQYVAGTYGRFDIQLDCVQDGKICGEGKEYIDFGTGIGVTAFGACDSEWVEAVTEQAKTLSHTSNLYYTSPCVSLAQMLCERTGMKKVFFGNSGAEANECAIKCARKYSFDKYGEGRKTIITLQNSFHGRTLLTLSATGQDVFHQYFGPFVDGFKHVPANDIDALREALTDDVCAFMFECVQGEGGVIALEKEYLTQAEKLCREKDILLICDEVQTGNGRTGSLYSYSQFGITPDIVSTAKGLGGGLPIGACLLGETVENTLTPSSHGSTFGGNPICCAGAVSIISRLTDSYLEDICNRAKYLWDKLACLDFVECVSGLGFMIGLVLKDGMDTKAFINACAERGLLVLSAKTKVRLLPPLNTGVETIDKAIAIMTEAAKAIKS
ncbi:MAG: aminotransferase class III-fold pyridoxal phosphate-dependent enzyme [Ruminococcaceae bacterium]|nr:aminotransferase class III-fold pyridoxal phosphate-dependent enzyme [Oscillospiraceae bacterium]